MQIDPYCQQWKCSPVNVVSRNVKVMQIFAGVREIWGVKQESGRLRCRFSYLSLAIFSESSFPRLKSATHSICVKLLHKHDKPTQCCRAFTLALARLSCITLLNSDWAAWVSDRSEFCQLAYACSTIRAPLAFPSLSNSLFLPVHFGTARSLTATLRSYLSKHLG